MLHPGCEAGRRQWSESFVSVSGIGGLAKRDAPEHRVQPNELGQRLLVLAVGFIGVWKDAVVEKIVASFALQVVDLIWVWCGS